MLPESQKIFTGDFEVDDAPGDLYVHNTTNDCSFLFVSTMPYGRTVHETLSLRCTLADNAVNIHREGRKRIGSHPRMKAAYDMHHIDFYRART